MENKIAMDKEPTIWSISGWIFSLALVVVGILNMALVHFVPGIAYLIISLVYFPPANTYIRKKLGFTIPLIVKLMLGIALFMFTLGVSDLGDMIDKL
ncbi:hypothetical protein ACFSRY_06570 [Pontibacter locisalis]|uniref:Uncharacterized protein n=1 Tax=Pontibacter locisalis TaxID=1719035 RepID=A0ABW5IKH8_9BACT